MKSGSGGGNISVWEIASHSGKKSCRLYFGVTDLECLQTADSWYIKLKHVLDIHLRSLESGLLLKVNVYV